MTFEQACRAASRNSAYRFDGGELWMASSVVRVGEKAVSDSNVLDAEGDPMFVIRPLTVADRERDDWYPIIEEFN